MADEENPAPKPVVIEAAFVMTEAKGPGLSQILEDAMVAALKECLENGIVAPEPQKRAMMDAYRRAKNTYYGIENL